MTKFEKEIIAALKANNGRMEIRRLLKAMPVRIGGDPEKKKYGIALDKLQGDGKIVTTIDYLEYNLTSGGKDRKDDTYVLLADNAPKRRWRRDGKFFRFLTGAGYFFLAVAWLLNVLFIDAYKDRINDIRSRITDLSTLISQLNSLNSIETIKTGQPMLERDVLWLKNSLATANVGI